ncbi:MAG: siderophore ferric iron reductase [Vibrio hibernica]
MSDPRYQQLFHFADHVTPYLRGELLDQDAHFNANMGFEDKLFANKNNQDLLQEIYAKLQVAHPEAGHAYWLNRTWTLLVWQPVYISFISIYNLNALPSLSGMTQHWKGEANFVAGFTLQDVAMHDGTPEQLIEVAAAELKPLFEHYREQLDQHIRIRPGFTNHLLADALVVALLRLQDLHKDLPQQYIPEQAQLWLQAFDLPLKALQSLTFELTTNQWRFVRTTCCMVYRCDGRDLCDNCPRKEK